MDYFNCFGCNYLNWGSRVSNVNRAFTIHSEIERTFFLPQKLLVLILVMRLNNGLSDRLAHKIMLFSHSGLSLQGYLLLMVVTQKLNDAACLKFDSGQLTDHC